MIVDTSVAVAILRGEREGRSFTELGAGLKMCASASVFFAMPGAHDGGFDATAVKFQITPGP